MTKTLSAREVINAKHMKNKTVVGLRIINIVSSHFFFFLLFNMCTAHYKLRSPFFQRTFWRRTCCGAVAGWCSSSEQSPGRCLAATQLRPAAAGQSFCSRSDCLMTCLQLRESRSSWSLFPGLCQACAMWRVWSSERLLRDNSKGNIRRQQADVNGSQLERWRSLRLITAKKPDVKECERRLLPSQSWSLGAGEWGEGGASHSPDSLWVTVCVKPTSPSSGERQIRNAMLRSKKSNVYRSHWRELPQSFDNPLPPPSGIHIHCFALWLEHSLEQSETLHSSITTRKPFWTKQ